MAIIDRLVAVLGFDLDPDSDRAAREYESRIDAIAQRVDRTLTTVGNVAAGMFAIAGTGAVMLGKSVFDAATDVEALEASLVGVEGGAEGAAAAMDKIIDKSANIPLTVREIGEAWRKAKAFGIDPDNGGLERLADWAAFYGKTVDQAVEALADAQTSEFERLKELGVKSSVAGDEVTFSGRNGNGDDFSRTIKNDASAIRNFMLELTGTYAGSLDAMAGTTTGQLQLLRNGWNAFLVDIGDSGVIAAFNRGLRRILDRMSELRESGQLEEWAEMLGAAMERGVDALFYITGALADFIGFLNRHKGALIAFGVAVGLAFAWAHPIIAAIGLLILVGQDLITWVRGGESAFGNLLATLRHVPGVGQGVAMVFDAIKWAINADWGAIGRAIKSSVENAWHAFLELLAKVIFLPADMAAAMLDHDWLGTGRSILNAIWDGMKAVGADLSNWLVSLIPAPIMALLDAGGNAVAEGGILDRVTVNREEAQAQRQAVGGFFTRVGNFAQGEGFSSNAEVAGRIANDRSGPRGGDVNTNVEVHVARPADAPAEVGRAVGRSASDASRRAQLAAPVAF